MSALDKVRSFAEAREPDDAVILAGITYGDAREMVAEVQRLQAAARTLAESEAALTLVAEQQDRMIVQLRAEVERLRKGAEGWRDEAEDWRALVKRGQR